MAFLGSPAGRWAVVVVMASDVVQDHPTAFFVPFLPPPFFPPFLVP